MRQDSNSTMIAKAVQLAVIAVVWVTGSSVSVGVARAQTLETLYSFDGTNGALPQARLAQGKDGHFYGTTRGGGPEDAGTIFRITANGELTPLAFFVEEADGDEVNDTARLIAGSDGNFYGTTFGDEWYTGAHASAFGAVFRMTPQGEITTIMRFNGLDGAHPAAELLEASDGNFYGTTYRGGEHNYGTVFKVTSNGVLTPLVSFDGFNGREPLAGLIRGTDGAIYGTTGDVAPDTSGFIFKLVIDGSWTNVGRLNLNEGGRPWGPLIEYSGSFYGTAINRSDDGYPRAGGVFKLTARGPVTKLAEFRGANGSGPVDGLVLGANGDFFGVTYQGGSSNLGSVFTMTPAGKLTTLFSFNGTNGALPLAGLTLARDGNFYGTTSRGGAQNQGTIFRIKMPISLAFRRAGAELILSWPINDTYVLQSTEGLHSATIWNDFLNSPGVVDGRFTTTSSASGAHRFFRLREAEAPQKR